MALADLVITPGLTVPARYLDWSAVRASGPGGQNVNKVASKVVLRFDFEDCTALAPDVRDRLRNLAKNRLDADGWLTIAAQTERDQPRNLDHALSRLSELIRAALIRPIKRRKTRPTAAARRRRLDDKRHTADKKANRRAPS